MKYQKKKATLNFIKHIDSFGGVNTADSIHSLKEDQLSECINLWCPNGALESRPGLKTENVTLHNTGSDVDSLRVFENNLPPFKAGDYCRIGAVAEVGAFYYSAISSYLLDRNGNKKTLGLLQYVGPNGYRITDIQNVVFVSGDAITGSGIFMVVTLIEYDAQTVTKRIAYYELDSNLEQWVIVNKKKFYTPTLLRYGRGNNYLSAVAQGKYKLKEPEKLEEINMVNGAFAVCFSCDDVSDTFYLPLNNFSLADDDLIVIEYAVSLFENKVVNINNVTNAVDVDLFGETVRITVDRQEGYISFSKNGQAFALPRHRGENSLKVTAYKYDNDKAFELFCNSAAQSYFDGRLLRAGSFNSSHKIFYSGKDNPFYFHENAHIAVGEKSFALTAVASQNRYLFLFKGNEIYRLRLEESRYYDIKNIVENDLPANISAPGYTLTVVHSTIGCDCPQSIAFCTNRLVWYHSDGFVYCLYGTNSYTEGSVYVLSPNISDQLKVDIDDKYNVAATSHEGYYFLSIKNKIFVMDALVSGFRYLSGLKNNTSGNGGLNWYIWQMPKGVSVFSLNSISGKLFAVLSYSIHNTRGALFLSEFSEECKRDTVMVIYGQLEEMDIEVAFASALITPNAQSPSLKKISFDIENATDVCAQIFSKATSGRPFYIKAADKEKKRSVFIPAYSCESAGIKLFGKAPVTINSLEFEFNARR